MKTKTLFLNLFSLAIAGFLAGCASTGNDKAASTASALTKSSELVAKGNTLIDETLASLNDLIHKPQPDLRKQFKTFNGSVNDLASVAKDVAGKADGMKAKGAAYFQKWDEEMAKLKNEDIRSRSEARKSEVATRFGKISQSYDEAKLAFQPFMSDLRDVQKFLATDLTIGGLSAIKDAAAKASKEAVPLKAALAKLSDDFKALGLAMSPTGPAK